MMYEELITLIQSRNFEGIKAEREKELYRIITFYKKGLTTETEAKDDFIHAVLSGTRNNDEILHLRKALGVSKLSHEESIQLIADYKHWTHNEEINGGWFNSLSFDWDLTYTAPSDGDALKLSVLEVLQLIDSILVPIFAYEIIPPEIPDPALDIIHVYTDQSVFAIPFDCVDDGGLLSDSDPVGKSFDLTRSDGVKMHVMITEFRREGAPYNHRDYVFYEVSDHYLGIGTIDDYYFKNTTPPKKNLSFELSKTNMINHVFVTAFHEGKGVDYSIDFPRWQAYLDYCREHKRSLDQEINVLWNNLIKKRCKW